METDQMDLCPNDIKDEPNAEEPSEFKQDEQEQGMGSFQTGTSETSLDLDLKSEEPDSGYSSLFPSTQTSDPDNPVEELEPDEDEEEEDEEEDQGEEEMADSNEDPLAALASAALDASKESKDNKTDFNGSAIPQEPVKVRTF